jgi:outer membrane protein assembly factor BamB
LNKTKKSAATTFILIFSIVAILMLPALTVQGVQIIETHAYAMISPDVAGVGQTVLVSYRIDKTRQGATDLTNHFEGFSVTITKPDGTTDLRSNLDVDSTSGGWFSYTPTEVGTYTFVTRFPEQWGNGSFFGTPFENLYLESTSAPVSLTVQEDPIPGFPGIPLPTEPWKRPISGENKGWWEVGDNWLMKSYDIPNRSFCMTNAFAPYTSAPNSAHILWSNPVVFGGMAGGPYGDTSYFTGLSYEQFYLPVVVEGRIFYTEHGPTTTTAMGTRVLDLYTGEEIHYMEGVDIDFAQILDTNNPNEHGLIAYLWEIYGPGSATTMVMYDAFTYRPILTVENVTFGGLGSFSGGATTFGPSGEILSYSKSGNNLICWNSTKAIYSRGFIDTWSPPYGGEIDGTRGIQYNVTIPNMPPGAISAIGDGVILAQDRDQSAWPWVVTDSAFDQDTGQLMWTKDRTNIYTAFFARATSIREGIYVVREEGRMTTVAYDLATGNQIWETEPLPNGWGIFEYQRDIAYGKVYTTGYTGAIRAFDAETGALAWKFDLRDAGFETVYGEYPTYHGFTIADNKIFMSNDEHSPDGVLWRGGRLYAVDTDTGEEVWSISGLLRNPVVVDGILTALNSYDGQAYGFGKGPSATTVSVPDIAVEVGQSFTITGTVTDQTPASKDTPAISDEDMSEWMEYLYMQKPIPGDAKGVPVSLDSIDPNGNLIHIGDTTSDMSGSFGFTWAPQVPGLYNVMATWQLSSVLNHMAALMLQLT